MPHNAAGLPPEPCGVLRVPRLGLFKLPGHPWQMANSDKDAVELFLSAGIDPTKAKEAAGNKAISQAFVEICELCKKFSFSIAGDRGQLLYLLAAKVSREAREHLPHLVAAVGTGELRKEAQLLAALAYAHRTNKWDAEQFQSECGVGVAESVTIDEIEKALKALLLGDSQISNVAGLIRRAKETSSRVRWADGRTLKQVADRVFAEGAIERGGADAAAAPAAAESAFRVFQGDVLRLHRPGENKQKSAEIMARHLAETGGKVRTRFPPEPNGFLHIGHAKAINLNFRYAQAHGGICFLRYDDTNPEAERQEYFDSILEDVRWLGFEPWRITYASDHFETLYGYAQELIRRGLAYACHQTQAQIRDERGGDDKSGARHESPWRNRPTEESLAIFAEMRQGKWAEGSVTIRMRQNMQSGNPYMWDAVAYRVLFKEHPRTGDRWCIYPTYDFTHCLCDSLENITHSLCTTEFIAAHESYDWVCDSLDVYKAFQWEYGRLAITHTVLSKRRLTRLVEEGIVDSWDDPRLYTLSALRRRGFPPAAINAFVEGLGVTTSASIVDVRLLEATVREHLNATAPRRMVVLDPIRVCIEDLPEGGVEWIEGVPEIPSSGGSVGRIPLSRHVWIERDDFSPAGHDASYRRLVPGGVVGLWRACTLRYLSHSVDAEGRVVEVRARRLSTADSETPASFIHWVADAPQVGSPVKIGQVRLYSELFRTANPHDNPDGWLADVQSDTPSLVRVDGAVGDIRILGARPLESFQLQRIGYFCVDPKDTRADYLVLNRTVPLKEDGNKG